MIFTVTLNPAIDYYIELECFSENRLNHIKTAYTLPGGKGINVSKVLKNFGILSTTLGFVGGFTGDCIKNELVNDNINGEFITIAGQTRINIKMKTASAETEIAGKSPHIENAEVNRFFDKIRNIQSGDILVLSGSVPDSLPKNIYELIIKQVPTGVKVILDTRGEPLKSALNNDIFLAKPNKFELEEFFSEKYSTEEEIIKAGKKLMKLGVENVIISLGKDGSILLTKDKIYRGNVPQGILKSSVGAGDSMVAGIIYGIVNGKDILESYRYGIASGSSTAFSEGLTTFENMEKLLNQINIEKRRIKC